MIVLQAFSATLGIKLIVSGDNLSAKGNGDIDGDALALEFRSAEDDSKILEVQLPQATDLGDLQDAARTAATSDFVQDDVDAFNAILMPAFSFFDYTGSKQADVAQVSLPMTS